MFKWIGALIDRLFAVIGALVFTQIPLFIQQYVQQLQGRVAELNWQISLVKKAAEQSGKKLPEYIQKFLENSDLDIMRQGEIIKAMVMRSEDLNSALTSLQNASLWSRPFVFFTHLNMDIVKSTFRSFHYGISFSLEGLVYAIVGIIFGITLFQMLKNLFIGFFRFFFPKKSPPTPRKEKGETKV